MDEKELEALKTSNPKAYEHIVSLKGSKDEADKIKKELDDLKAKSKSKDDPKPDPDDLSDKARKEKESKEKQGEETRRLESALTFNLSLSEFLKSNKDLLPGEIDGIVKAADKERYESAIEKAGALKSGMIKEFFLVQTNLDLLTKAQRTQVEEYLKLSPKGREEKAASVFENIFEPALETLKKIKKAEEVGRSTGGHHTGSKAENDYKNKMINIAKKTHLGEKGA